MPCSRLWAATLACGLAALPSAAGRAAPPVKPETTRKAFDYRRPDPGEVLPNPSAGVGTPPRLLEYSPTTSMGEASGGAAPPDPPPGTPVVAEQPPAPEPSPTSAAPAPSTSVKAAPAPSPAPTPAPAGATPPLPDLQALFAAAVMTAGIDGLPAALPEADAPADPVLRAAAERAWADLASSLAASTAAWGERLPNRTPAALDRVESRAEPGRLAIVSAPGRLTGAFDQPPP